MRIKAAVFDMDGTLVDSLMFWDIFWGYLGEHYLQNPAFTPSPEDDKKVRTMTLRDAMELIHVNYGIEESGEALTAVCNAQILDFYTNTVQLKPGVQAFLKHCYDRGVKMCVASASARDFVELVMERCGIRRYFVGVLSCADLGKGKDQPDIFLRACEFLGEAPADTWLFEDSLVAIETAKKIGMPAVGIYDRFNYGQEMIKKLADHYIAPGETLEKILALE